MTFLNGSPASAIQRVLAVVLACGLAFSAVAAPADDEAYTAYLGLVKSGAAFEEARASKVAPYTIGLKLRTLYTRTSFYKPYSDPGADKIKEASGHRQEKRFAECLAAAQAAIEVNFTNLQAHYLASRCSLEAGQPEQSKSYVRNYLMLLASIIYEPGRDGRTPETAYKVISVGEEYFAMSYLKLQPGGQSLVNGPGGISADCHIIKEPPPNAPDRVCFDVTVPMGQISKEPDLPPRSVPAPMPPIQSQPAR